MVPRSLHPTADLREAVTLALTHDGALFTAGERLVLHRMLALSDDAAEVFARLTLRVGLVFRMDTFDYEAATPEACRELETAELVSRAVPDALALTAFTAEVLKDACARLGLSRAGPRAALEARLLGQPWRATPVWFVGFRALLARVTRLGGFDRAMAPVERLTGSSWADYAPTGGPGAFPTRRALRLCERARSGQLAGEEVLAVLAGGPPEWGRSPYKHALEALLSVDPPADALAGLAGAAVPYVRALEREDRRPEALARCRGGDRDPEVALALARTGRRLARALGEPWAPAEPLREAPTRRLWLKRAPGEGFRPQWRAGGGASDVELAAVAALAGAGRESLHAENWLWLSAFALVFRALYWLPLPGRLPTPRRAGPLDLGTPTFFTARAEAAEAVLRQLRAEGIAPFVAAWQGERLDGLSRAEEAVPVLTRLDGDLLAGIVERLAREGWAAAHGLPDLLVLPGAPGPLADAVPGLLPLSAFLAEIKGPSDALRDGQRIWHDWLIQSKIHVEVWYVAASE